MQRLACPPGPPSLLLVWATPWFPKPLLQGDFQFCYRAELSLTSKHGLRLWRRPGWQPPLLGTPQGFTAPTRFLSLEIMGTLTAVTLPRAEQGPGTCDLLPPLPRGSWVSGPWRAAGPNTSPYRCSEWPRRVARAHSVPPVPWSPAPALPGQYAAGAS